VENKEFARLLEKRTKLFAVSVIRLSAELPNTAEARVIKNQITKSGTSVGANYREANRARSRADFKNKITICASEASETQYWMEIMIESGFMTPERAAPEYKECSELLAIFTTIARAK